MKNTVTKLAKIALAAAFLAVVRLYAGAISHHDTAAAAAYSHR
jgi:hypothetical protein